jgi:hypothetical protein
MGLYTDSNGDGKDDLTGLTYSEFAKQNQSQTTYPTDGRSVILTPGQRRTVGHPSAPTTIESAPVLIPVGQAKDNFRGGLIAGDPATQSIANWMYQSGIITKDPTTRAGIDQASSAYNKAVDYTADANAFGDMTKNVMDMLSVGYGTDTTKSGGSSSGGTSTYKQYSTFTKEQARKKAVDAYRAVLGRSPDNQEIAEFTNGLISAAKADPTIQKTTTKGKGTSQKTQQGFNEKDWTLGFLSSKIPAKGDLLGASGTAQDMITSFSEVYGVKLSPALAFDTVRDVVQGKIDQTGVEQMFKQQAKIAFPHLSEKIDAGMNPRQIADAYISNTTKILEKGITEVDMFHPYVKEAMSQKDDKGNYVLPTADEQAQMLRSKKEWLNTRNGKETLMSAADNILKTMGFE